MGQRSGRYVRAEKLVRQEILRDQVHEASAEQRASWDRLRYPYGFKLVKIFHIWSIIFLWK